jgi:uncharacterized protein (UPF0548 family)
MADRRDPRAPGLTYSEVGGTRAAIMPAGYRSLTRTVALGRGEERFERAAKALLGWEMHRGAGLRVRASSPRVVTGAVAVLTLGLGPLRVEAPVEVVYVLDEPRRRGFAYGTLPGHPETGEEAFIVERHDDETVTLTIIAFSRPATTLARLSGPAGRLVQSRITSRYLRALDAG